MNNCPVDRGREKNTLPKSSLLRKPREYNDVYRRGKRIRGQNITIIFADNGGGESRLGISVHGVKRAVRRNRIKRLLREFFRLHRQELPTGYDIVFAVRRKFAADTLQEIADTVFRLLPPR